jgi:hypothetical protein
MKRLSAALALACALTGTATASAIDFGANDDTGKYFGAGSAAYFTQMAAAGLKQNVMTLKWDPSAPMTIPDKAFLDGSMPIAQATGIKVVFALYGTKPTTFTGDGGTAEAFAAWAAPVARTFPSVKVFIIGNEPNQPRFWRPQFDASGARVSAAAFGPVLAATYDALKGVDPANRVVGIGLSPRGNDRPDAPSNISSSPTRWLSSFGEWYRASGRTAPVMDALSVHPYPNANTDALTQGYAWPNVGLVNLDRLKQAVEDAFRGTSHPTVRAGLKLFLDEYGYQVATEGNASYSGSENVPVISEDAQAQLYGQVPRIVACDPAIESFSIFGFHDEGDRGAGFQAGLVRKDGTPRASLITFRDAIAAGCTGSTVNWSPTKSVVGAAASFNDASPKPAKQKAWQVQTTAGEDATARVGLFKVKNATATRCTPGRIDVLQIFGTQSGNAQLVFDDEFDVKAGYTPLLQLDKKTLKTGCYFYAVILEAAMNDQRTSTFSSKAFRAGPAAKPAKPAKKGK